MIFHPCLRSCACALVLLAGPAAGGAWAAEAPATPPAQPTPVGVSFFCRSIAKVDSVDEAFNADCTLWMEWNDPRLAELPPGQVDSSTIWRPKVEVVNSLDAEDTWEPYLRILAPGKLRLVSRFHGSFSAPMDLHDFPFDHQVLPIELESLVFTTQQVVFSDARNHPETKGRAAPLKPEEALGNDARMPEWNLKKVQVRELDMSYRLSDSRYSRYRIEILVSRRPGFYVWKIMAIEAMILMLSWAVFLLDAGELGNRLGVSVTLLLATVAFSYVVSEITPRISYLTLLDWFLLGCFALIFLSALESALVYLLQRRGTGAAATARIDRWSLAAFPVLFLLLNLLLWMPILV